MANINRTITASTTAGLIIMAIGAGITPSVAVWPEFEKPVLLRQTNNSTYTAVRYAEQSSVSAATTFQVAVQNVFCELLNSQSSLGGEFEEAIYSDLESLYEA